MNMFYPCSLTPWTGFCRTWEGPAEVDTWPQGTLAYSGILCTAPTGEVACEGPKNQQ